ncbi:NAD-dependent protein deacetylase [Aeromicrobium sp.]
MPPTDTRPEAAITALLGERTTLVLTGAGVSTDSGIPDYRGPNSPARKPMTFQEFVSGRAMQQRYWARAHVGWQRLSGARPNATHVVLARMQDEERLSGLITQNVDGLHEFAGHRDVVDLHGRIDRIICLTCRVVSARQALHRRLSALNPGHASRVADFAPDGDALLEDTDDFRVAPCEHCGGVLKPDVVFFGENVPRERVAQCTNLVDQAESLLVLGSSLQVMSGLRFVRQARARGLPVVIVNRGTTRGDDLADLKLDAGCAETLAPLLHRTTDARSAG